MIFMYFKWIKINCGSGNEESLCGRKMLCKSVILCLFIILSFDSNVGTSKESPAYSVCTTEECYKLAKLFQKLLHFTVAPCDKFAEFVCGENFNLFTDMSYTVFQRIVGLLQKPVIYKANSTEDSARALYQGCIQSVHVNKSSLIRSIPRELRNYGGMPLIPDSEYDPSLNWLTKLAIIYRQLPINAIFGFEVVQDLKHEKPKYLSFSRIEEFGIPKEGVVGSDNYRVLIKGFVCLLRPGNCGENDVAQVEDDIESLVLFERDLAKLRSASPKESMWDRYKKHSIRFLMEKIPEFDWLTYIKEVFRETDIAVSEETEVVFMDMDYFIGLSRIINRTDPKTIANYLGWRIIEKMPVLKTFAFRKYILKFEPRLPLNPLIDTALIESTCVDLVKELFPHTVGKLYVEQHFRAMDKEKIEVMANGIRRAVKAMIKENSWMDEGTREEALKKIKNMEQFISYPAWISDEKQIEQLEGLPEPCHREKFFTSLMRTYHYRQCKELSEINHLTKKDRWLYSAADMRAYYNPMENSLYVAAGISQPPFYYPNSIDALIYGAQGFLIGHELSHGFDKIGKEFDGNGVLRSWWTNSTIEKYEEEAECLVEQYGSIVDRRVNLKLNGRRTFTENQADNRGLQRAYEAYMMTHPRDIRLPGLEHLSHTQLFFIAFGMSSCRVHEDAMLKDMILYSDHSAPMYRISIPPRNLKAFAEAFNCPKGSPMNPDKRCKM